MPTYNRGDILESVRGERTVYTIIIHTPAQRHDDRYEVLDLILVPTVWEWPIGKWGEETGSLRVPRQALRYLQETDAITEKFHKVDHVDLDLEALWKYDGNGLFFRPQAVPGLEKYLRVVQE